MMRTIFERGITLIAVLILAAGSFPLDRREPAATGGDSYEDLVLLFKEWREFVKPAVVDGVPDYSPAAMKAQREKLPAFQKRLAAIDSSRWPVAQQVDYHVVRAEMNGLDFDHRFLRPWSRMPFFYMSVTDPEHDVPLREGPEIYDPLDLWKYEFPLGKNEQAEFKAKLAAVPGILAQGKKNLVEETKDLWTLSLPAIRSEVHILEDLAKQLAKHHSDLVHEVERAKAAVSEFLV